MEEQELDNSSTKGLPLKQSRKKKLRKELQGKFKKSQPLMFNEESEEGFEAWLINMRKYFQVYECKSNLKSWLATYQLQGKVSLWWDRLKQSMVLKVKSWNGKHLKKNQREIS